MLLNPFPSAPLQTGRAAFTAPGFPVACQLGERDDVCRTNRPAWTA